MAKERQKTTMEILQEIRELRNDYWKSKNDNSVSVVKVEVLGVGKQTQKPIYRLVEEKNVENHETGEFETEISELFYEYDNEPKLIAVRNPKTNGEIVPKGIDGDENKDWDILKEEIEQCLEEREKQLKALAKELGISEEEIESLSEIDLEQKVEEKSQEQDEGRDEDEPQEISEEEMKQSGMVGMNEVKLNTQVDAKGTTLAKELGLEGYSKIIVVHSYKLAELTGTDGEKEKPYSASLGIIAQKTDGTFEKIPKEKLSRYTGANNQFTEINNKENVEVKTEDCVYVSPKTGKKIVINQKDPYGIPEVYLGQSTHKNDRNVAQRLQDRYDGTERQDVEVRALFNQNKGEYQIDKMQDEVEGHIKAGCKDLDKDEVDGDPNTGHQHDTEDRVITPDTVLIYEGREMKVAEIAASPRFKMNRVDEFIEQLNKSLSEGNDLKTAYEDVEKYVNEYAPDLNMEGN